MKTLIYLKNQEINKVLLKYLEEYQELEPKCISDKNEFLNQIKNERIYLALVSLKYADFVEIIDKIKAKGTGTVIYLIGDSDEESVNVYKYRCDGFLNIKNMGADISYLLDNFFIISKRIHRLKVAAFGRFELFVDDERMNLHNNKAEELLALCVDKCGGKVSIEEATDKLWYGRPYDDKVKGLYRKAVMNINAFFKAKKINDFFINGRGYCCIKKDSLDCDYYKFPENPKKKQITLSRRIYV